MHILNDDWYIKRYRQTVFDEKYGVFGVFSSTVSQVGCIAFGHTSHAQLERDFTTESSSMVGGGAMTYEQDQIRLTGTTFNRIHPPISHEILEKVIGIVSDILQVDTVILVPRDELVRKKR